MTYNVTALILTHFRKMSPKTLKNDESIMDLEEKPTLIMNFITGTNIEKGDLLFDEWKEAS